MKMPAGTHVLVGIAVAAVLIAVVSGLIVLGPPNEERIRRLDGRRVEDLRGITRAVDLYWTRHGGLPTSLDELSGESGVNINSHDPGTSQPYDYQVLDDKTYELCARFQRDSPEPTVRSAQPRQAPSTTPASQRVRKSFWSHGAGRQCFRPAVEQVLP
jgi:hypothetical protein